MEFQISSSHLVDLSREELVAHALKNKEGVLSNTGALTVTTGKRTGRSPKDRFIVKDVQTEQTVDWGTINQPIAPEIFDKLWTRAVQALSKKPAYVSHLQVGADEQFALPVLVVTENAWHNLFAQNLFIHPVANNLSTKESWTLVSVPSLTTDPKADGVHSDGVLILNLSARKVLLLGLRYAGEIKKAMFSVLNYFLPPLDVLPMHCAANQGHSGDVALFFGLSGTGKTTLSADPNRLLIGDDEHGWSASSVFNFEGGCYAKCIDLSKESEPMIWDAIHSGAVMENVVLKANGEADFTDSQLTQNTRVAYPREHIALRVLDNKGPPPSAVIFLTCDLFGVLPPVALLDKYQAAYYFLSGYTALIGSTEFGSTKSITPTFSACFGAAFFPRNPLVYANLLIKRIEETGCPVYLINTGWTGGSYTEGGKRFSIAVTRALVQGVLSKEVNPHTCEVLPGFNLKIPTHLPEIASEVLNPRKTWKNPNQYDQTANSLITKFQENFTRFKVPSIIANAGPKNF